MKNLSFSDYTSIIIMKRIAVIFLPLSFLLFNSCKKEKDAVAEPQLIFTITFDSLQARQNNIGQPSVIPAGHAAQSPVFNRISAHYVELAPNELTALGSGKVLYLAPETTTGGANAIDFSRAVITKDGEAFLKVPLSSLSAGTYNWLRVSLAYQDYTIKLRASGQNLTGTIASFIGYRTYIRDVKVKDSTVVVNANKNQGFWAFETSIPGFGFLTTGQAPAGATTVPNPIFATSPIPSGSCVVTGRFASPLVISGTETKDINIRVSLSTNKSFEWIDADGNGTYDPMNGDQVVDMGIRGMIPVKL